MDETVIAPIIAKLDASLKLGRGVVLTKEELEIILRVVDAKIESGAEGESNDTFKARGIDHSWIDEIRHPE